MNIKNDAPQNKRQFEGNPGGKMCSVLRKNWLQCRLLTRTSRVA